MNTGGSHQPEPPTAGANGDGVLDAYVDGALAGPERHAFESRLAHDPGLRAALESQRRIDDSLRSLFVVPPPPLLPVNGNGEHTDPTPAEGAAGPAPSSSATSAAAGSAKAKITLAVLLLALSASITAWNWQLLRGHSAEIPARERLSLEETYEREVASGFRPEMPYPGDKQLAAVYRAQFGRGLTFRTPSGATPVGLSSFGCGMGSGRVALLARVNGREVIVTASHPALAGPAPGEACDGGDADAADAAAERPRRFRREVGGFVLDEITPFDRPHLLDRFSPAPAAPAQ